MTKKQRNKFYKKILRELSFSRLNNTFRVCIELNHFAFKNQYSLNCVLEIFHEFALFQQNINEENEFYFFVDENPDDLRIIALQLCIEMTK